MTITPDMLRPDYHGGGLVNLMSSIIRARGGSADTPDADLLPSASLAPVPHLVLLIIDGLGATCLARHSPQGLLNRHCLGTLTSVFPSTTAAAITTCLTGVAPQQHAVTGWFTWLRELGCVMRILPGQPRYGGPNYDAAGIDLRQLFTCPSLFDRITTPAAVFSPREIAHSAFNKAHLGRAQLYPFNDVAHFNQQLLHWITHTPAPSYAYAYWSQLDRLGHHYGIGSREVRAHVLELEYALAQLMKQLTGHHVTLIIAADHGQIDTTPAVDMALAAHPHWADCLCMPLCGEPRAAFCYVRPQSIDAFMRYYHDVLAPHFLLERSDVLLAQGYFGTGPAHPELIHRIGDYVLLGRDCAIMRDRLLTEKPFVHIGVHGGLSRDELLIPLCVLTTS